MAWHFGVPRVLWRAGSWRLRLLGWMQSKSTRPRVPTPHRQRASAAQEPTPPSPQTRKALFRRRSNASGPDSSSSLDKSRDMGGGAGGDKKGDGE